MGRGKQPATTEKRSRWLESTLVNDQGAEKEMGVIGKVEDVIENAMQWKCEHMKVRQPELRCAF